MANGLYKASEIACMTSDALDELMSHYSDTGNAEGVRLVQRELDDRAEAAEIAYTDELIRLEELEWEAEEARRQQLHDEMINDMMAQDGRWG